MHNQYSLKTISFAVGSACNIKCRMCTLKHEDRYPGRFWLTLEEFKKMWEPMLPHLKNVVVRLDAWGEPMAHPDSPEMIEYLAPHVKGLFMLTNGTKLSQISESALSACAVQVSLEGAQAATHNYMCVGADWDVIWYGMRRIRDAGGLVSVATVLMRQNKDEILDLLELFAKEKLRKFRLMHVVGEEFALDPDEERDIVAATTQRAKELGIDFDDAVTPFVDKGSRCLAHHIKRCAGGSIWCPYAFENMCFGEKGYSRCRIFMGQDVFADKDTSILDAWTHTRMREVRRQLLDGKPDAMCTECVERNIAYENELLAADPTTKLSLFEDAPTEEHPTWRS